MRRQAVVFSAPRQIDVVDETIGRPANGQVLVQTIASAISHGTELLIYGGQAPSELAADETISALSGTLSFPLRYGYAAVGRVIEVGPEAPPAWLGRTVFAFQPHASHFLANHVDLLALPDELPPEQAVFLPNLETAVNLLLDGQPLVGEQVAVFGQGIVGLLTVALLARLPLATLISLDRHAPRRQASVQLGARASLDPMDANTPSRLMELLQEDREYAGADLTYEISGSPVALDQAIAATGFAGRIVVASWYGQKRAELDLGSHFHRGRLRLISSQVSTLAPELSGRWTRSRRLRLTLSLLREVDPTPFITHRFPVEKAAQAYRLLDESPGEAIQVVLTY